MTSVCDVFTTLVEIANEAGMEVNEVYLADLAKGLKNSDKLIVDKKGYDLGQKYIADAEAIRFLVS